VLGDSKAAGSRGPGAVNPVSVPSSKRTMEFGSSAKKEPAAQSAPLPQSEPSAPIDLHEPAEQETFQVSTLAEMAQVDEQGDLLQPDAAEDAIDLTQSAEEIEPISEPPAGVAPADTGLPIAEAVKQRARVASADIEKGVDGLTPDQVEAIRVLTTKVIERVVWEIVPDLAETIIKEEIAKLLEE